MGDTMLVFTKEQAIWPIFFTGSYVTLHEGRAFTAPKIFIHVILFYIRIYM
jgi:hypothetical protein